MEGVAPSVVNHQLNANAAKREQLEALIYRTKVRELAKVLQEPESRSEATAALRGFVDAITPTPNASGDALQIDPKGNLAATLSAAQNATRSPEIGDLELQIAMVAGARNTLNLEFAWTAA